MANVAEDVDLNVWEVSSSKNLKLDQILSMKMAQEKPRLREFSTLYRQIMRDIHSGEERLNRVNESPVNGKWEGDEITSILSTHKEVFAKELSIFSQNFDTFVNEIIQTENGEEAICILTKFTLR
jgi:hypothetical protein